MFLNLNYKFIPRDRSPHPLVFFMVYFSLLKLIIAFLRKKLEWNKRGILFIEFHVEIKNVLLLDK